MDSNSQNGHLMRLHYPYLSHYYHTIWTIQQKKLILQINETKKERLSTQEDMEGRQRETLYISLYKINHQAMLISLSAPLTLYGPEARR